MKDDFGNRMKGYEAVTDMRLPGLTPVVVRVDGKCFHTLTKKLDKPFDRIFNSAMELTMRDLCEKLPNVRFAYVQSDEISLVMLERDIRSESWFGNRLQKIVSLTAAYATASFRARLSAAMTEAAPEGAANRCGAVMNYAPLVEDAVFDCRAFPVPEKDVCNYFIWRQQDCLRNAIQAAGQVYVGKKELHGMSSDGIIAALKEKGLDFSLYFSVRERLGAACYRIPVKVGPGGICTRMKFWTDANIPLFWDDREFIEEHMGMGD